MNDIIGGEFSVSEELLKENSKGISSRRFYSSGRAALHAILSDIGNVGGKIIHIPNFLCSSITQTIIDSNWDFRFYNINSDLNVDLSRFETGDEKPVILLINYFGLIDLDNITKELKKKYPNSLLILDNVQAYYGCINDDIDYAFNSFRKWFPCPDGAEAWKKGYGYLSSKDQVCGRWSQYKLAGNLLKIYTGLLDDSIALELIEKGEELLDGDYQVACSKASQRIFSNIDLDEIAAIRKSNAHILHERLEELGIQHLYKDDVVPLFIPIFINNRDELRRRFFAENIFTPVHWKSAGIWMSGENELYERELSLIVDQRYGIEEMLRQLKVLETMRKY